MRWVTKWDVPEGGGAPLLTCPNIPKPLHKLNPRTIMGVTEWNKTRKACYEACDYTCEACGRKCEKGKCHCLEPGTEVLTRHGWCPIENITLDDEVAQFYPSQETIEFTKPEAVHKTRVSELYTLGYKDRFQIGMSNAHRVLLKIGKGSECQWETVLAQDCKRYCGRAYSYIPTAGFNPKEGSLTADERLLIALNADGYVMHRNSDSKYNSHPERSGMYCSCIRVFKERKKRQLLGLLRDCCTPYKVSPKCERGGLKVVVWTNSNPKNFWDCFDINMGATKATQFIDELVKWDGWEGMRKGFPGRCWYTVKPDQADFVQAIAAQGGITTTYSVAHRPTRNWTDEIHRHPSSECLPQINIEFLNKTKRGTQTMSLTTKEYNGYVYCITVPSSYFLARTKDKYVFITGNCHELYDIDYKACTATFKRVVGLCVQCVDAETEVLTAEGWKKIPLVTCQDKVACWDTDNSIEFLNPTNTVVTHPTEAVQVKRNDTVLLFSPNHRLLLKVASKQSPNYGQIKVIEAKDYKASHYYNWLSGGFGKAEGKSNLSPLERLYIAIEADGHLEYDKESPRGKERQRTRSNRYGTAGHRYTYGVRLGKERKIQRFVKLLQESGVKYEERPETGGEKGWVVWLNVDAKHFANCFSMEMNAEKAQEFLEELVFWDGTYTKGQTVWYTNKLEEADFVQGVAAQCNMLATIGVVNRLGNLRKGQWQTPYERLSYAVSIRSKMVEYSGMRMIPEIIKWDKPMYCITVPTSFFVARRDGLVFVTGNCHVGYIHSGRAITCYQNHIPLWTKEYMLTNAERAFKLIDDWNKKHPDDEPLRVYATIKRWLEDPSLATELKELIGKYHIKFWGANNADGENGTWSKWKLIYDDAEYYSPYEDMAAWAEAMEENNSKPENRAKNLFAGDEFEELRRNIKNASM